MIEVVVLCCHWFGIFLSFFNYCGSQVQPCVKKFARFADVGGGGRCSEIAVGEYSGSSVGRVYDVRCSCFLARLKFPF